MIGMFDAHVGCLVGRRVEKPEACGDRLDYDQQIARVEDATMRLCARNGQVLRQESLQRSGRRACFLIRKDFDRLIEAAKHRTPQLLLKHLGLDHSINGPQKYFHGDQ